MRLGFSTLMISICLLHHLIVWHASTQLFSGHLEDLQFRFTCVSSLPVTYTVGRVCPVCCTAHSPELCIHWPGWLAIVTVYLLSLRSYEMKLVQFFFPTFGRHFSSCSTAVWGGLSFPQSTSDTGNASWLALCGAECVMGIWAENPEQREHLQSGLSFTAASPSDGPCKAAELWILRVLNSCFNFK